MTAKPGRNDPCACGSGKKYKHCCYAADNAHRDSPQELVARRLRRLLGDFHGQMLRFVAELYGPEAIDEAWAEFWLWEGPELDARSPFAQLFWPWMYHVWEPDPLEPTCVDASLHNRAPTRELLARRGARLDPLLRRYLEACVVTPFSFHEIRRAEPGHGFLARDVITGAECEVLDRLGSEGLAIGDIVYGQLVEIDGVGVLEACSPYVLSPVDKIPIIDLRARVLRRESGAIDARALLREWEIELRELYHELVRALLDPSPPELRNTDGDPLVPTRAMFAVESADETLAALQRYLEGEPGGESRIELVEADRGAHGEAASVRFGWVKAGKEGGGGGVTVLGEGEITSDRLTVEFNSTEREAAFRRVVENALGDAARCLGSEAVELEDDDEPEAAAGEFDESAGFEDVDEPSREQEDDLIDEDARRLIAAHYDEWPTHELPALGGVRPIDAVGDPDGREKVDALLCQMQRDARRLGVDPQVFERLRGRLGL